VAKIGIIGGGFSSLSAACYLAQAGHEVHIFEKNKTVGGRARQIRTDNGYVFDMGPSWYWMPDVFERFFGDFGHRVSDFYEVKALDPAFEMVFPQQERFLVPDSYAALREKFESVEQGSAAKLDQFMDDARFKYEVGMKKIVYKPGLSLLEFVDSDILRGALRFDLLSSFSTHVRRYFSDPRLLALMEFPVLFLGAMPRDTPALYSLMNYAGLKLGTWYPMGGFGKVIDGMAQLALNLGVKIHCDANVERIATEGRRATHLMVNGIAEEVDAVLGGADYHHVENSLLGASERNYSDRYWKKKIMAPSCLIFFVGVRKKLKKISHHTLFFEEDLLAHSREIYKTPKWPEKPLFYVCCPSQSDPSVAPVGHENLFLLMPIAPGLEDNDRMREHYYDMMMGRLEHHLGESLRAEVDYKQSYCIDDFVEDYNSFRGNAYGLANTLMQTANLKPKIRNRKIDNLFYCGQLTVPGPGVPPAIISGKIAAQQIELELKRKRHEAII
jgi:phytoene desaturase